MTSVRRHYLAVLTGVLNVKRYSRPSVASGHVQILKWNEVPSFFLQPVFAHPRRAPSLALFSLTCSISAPPGKGKELAATQAASVNALSHFRIMTHSCKTGRVLRNTKDHRQGLMITLECYKPLDVPWRSY